MRLFSRRRLRSLLLVLSSASASWLAMMVVHEAGHVLSAYLSGGRVERVILSPLAFSRTDLSPNPHPALVAWAGPTFGMAGPLLAWVLARAGRWRLAFLLRFLAGFCLIANGAYLSSALAMPVGDALDLLNMGSPAWLLATLGLASCLAGLALWNRLGTELGVGAKEADPAALPAALAALVVLASGMTAWTLLT
jgi:hypothetical protein